MFLCLFPDDQIYLTLFRIAFQHNLKIGDAKVWLSCLFERLVKDHPEFKKLMKASEPRNPCSLVTPVEDISGKNEYVEPFWNKSADNVPPSSCSASVKGMAHVENHTSRLSWSKPHYVVPDFLVYMDSYPGVSSLVIEVKEHKEDDTDQLLTQMLSKLHFQDVVFFQDAVFGIMITPIRYIMTAIIKTETELHIVKADWDNDLSLIKFGSKKSDTKFGSKKSVPLNVDSIHTLHKYISSVLQWASKTRCKLDSELTW